MITKQNMFISMPKEHENTDSTAKTKREMGKKK